MPDIRLRFGKDMLVVEGPLEPILSRQGFPDGECLEELNILDPEAITDIHRLSVAAGSHCLVTNTAGASRLILDEHGVTESVSAIVHAGVLCARELQPQHLFATVGPCGIDFSDTAQATKDLMEEAAALYREQMTALLADAPDALFIRGFDDIADVRCALRVARELGDTPRVVACSFDAAGRMPHSGTALEDAVAFLIDEGADVVGIDCGLDSQALLPLVRRLMETSSVPAIAFPDASQDATGGIRSSADRMAETAETLMAHGVQFIGAGRGGTPAHTGAIWSVIADHDVVTTR